MHITNIALFEFDDNGAAHLLEMLETPYDEAINAQAVKYNGQYYIYRPYVDDLKLPAPAIKFCKLNKILDLDA